METPLFSLAAAQVRTWSEEEYAARLSAFLDEQPHLVGFLFNLSEDFEEEEHEALLRTALLLNEGFGKTQLNVGLITQDHLQIAIDDVTAQLDDLSDDLTDEEMLDLDKLARIARSPFVFEEMRGFLQQELHSGLPADQLHRHNLLVLIDVLIGAFEEAIVLENKKENE